MWWQPLSDCSRPLPRLHWDKTIELSVLSPLDWTAQADLCRPWNAYHVHLWQWSQLCLCGIYWLYSRLGHPTCHLQSPSPKGEWLGWISSQDNEVHYQQSQQTGTDVWNAILEWRNSPTPSQGSSPVQRLMSCWTRSFLLCQESLYKPEVQSAVTAQVMRKTQPAKHYHVQSAKQLPSLVIGQPVWVKAHPEQPHSDWKSGVILQNIAPCSYLVEVNGCTYCWNRVHLRDAVQSQTGSLPVQVPDLAQTPGLPENKCANNDHDPASNQPLLRKVPATSLSSNTPPASSNLTQTRSGWIVKPNNLFKDFVQWEI